MYGAGIMSVLLEELEKEGSVLLETYGHQVSGHHLIFGFKDTICKPLNPREHFFYQTAPLPIRRYIPAYHGVISVRYVHQPSGEIHAMASPRDQPKATPPPLHTTVPDGSTIVTNHSESSSSFTSTSTSTAEGYQNPWVTIRSQVLNEKLKKLGEEDLEDITKDYMILENLTLRFRSPSVLDLKVGTRQHGDDAPPHKVVKHLHTCAISTSSSLGVRMGGMQKFDASSNQYTFYDKYLGKQLTVEELSQVLCSFLSNGVCFRSDLLPHLINMLKDLQARIKAMPTSRYFSSSLLIIYDGAECPEGLGVREGNQHPWRGEMKEGNDVPSTNHVISMENRLEGDGKYVDPIFPANSVSSTEMRRGSKECPNLPENSVLSTPLPSCTETGRGSNDCFMSDEELALARDHIDLRMIDFAHTTHSRYKDPILYEGPDEGYLTGLDSLIAIFNKAREMGGACNGNGMGLH